MAKRLNADIDDDLEALLDACVADSDYEAETKYIRNLIREDAEERGLTAADAPDADDSDEQSIVETYDPDAEGVELTKDELKRLSGDVDEINPDHVPRDTIPNGHAEALVTAMTRYKHDRVHRDDVVQICKSVGLTSNHYLRDRKNDLNVPGLVVDRLGGGTSAKKAGSGRGLVDSVDDEKVVGAALATAMDPPETEADCKPIWDSWKDVRDDVVETRGDSGGPVVRAVGDIIDTALFEMMDWLPSEQMADVHLAGETSAEERRDEWPGTPRQLVDWYCESKDKDDVPEPARQNLADSVEGWL
ncbi:hypothetical protein [Halostella litorea]|uniref:hypothetical protein n=1 Tax=Halostella litorea TaxID=2528831 RepID=UPI001091E474|nr:hypothetical protein [Halostella litorea]